MSGNSTSSNITNSTSRNITNSTSSNITNSTCSNITVYQHRQKCCKIGWDINRNIFLLKGKCLFLRLYAHITLYAMDGICMESWLNHHTCFQPATWMPETYRS